MRRWCMIFRGSRCLIYRERLEFGQHRKKKSCLALHDPKLSRVESMILLSKHSPALSQTNEVQFPNDVDGARNTLFPSMTAATDNGNSYLQLPLLSKANTHFFNPPASPSTLLGIQTQRITSFPLVVLTGPFPESGPFPIYGRVS